MSCIETIDDMLTYFDKTEQGTEEWKRLTENSIGGSSCSVVNGKNQYMKADELLNQMLKKTKRKEGSLLPCFHGQICEAIHVQMFEELLGYDIGICGFHRFAPQKHFSPDAVAVSDKGDLVLFEFKTPFSRYAAKTANEIKTEYKCQIQYSMGGFPFHFTFFSEIIVLYENQELNQSAARRSQFLYMGRFELELKCAELPGTRYLKDLTPGEITVLCKNFIKTDYIKIELDTHSLNELKKYAKKFNLQNREYKKNLQTGKPGSGNIIVRGFFGPWHIFKVYPNKDEIQSLNIGVDRFLECYKFKKSQDDEKDHSTA